MKMMKLGEVRKQEFSIYNAAVQKFVMLVAVAALVTLFFHPSVAFFGYDYKPGDVATVDVKSPVNVDGSVTIKKGEILFRDGQIVTEDDIVKLNAVAEATREHKALLPALGFFIFFTVFAFITFYFASRNVRKFSASVKDLLLMAVVFMGVVLMLRFSNTFSAVMSQIIPGMHQSAFKFVIPFAVAPMLIRLLLNSETALVFTAFTSIITGLFFGVSAYGLEGAAYSLAGGVAAAAGVRHCTHRSIVIRAGVLVGLVNVAVLLSFYAVGGGVGVSVPFSLVAAGLVNGIASAVLAVGLAPVLESAFRYTTDIKLLEISRMDHPLLKELAMRSPGTYHHSVIIGTLAEAAAESINANPLLARVGSYYHDIGKIRMPQYFIENVSASDSVNPHEGLEPEASSLIVVKHIKDGVELAREHRLGEEIIDIIQQHHGTSLVSYFYQKASAARHKTHPGTEAGDEPDESDYRYPGPKPQTKEAGIIMLADAMEAASRTLDDPTPERIKWLTQKLVNKIFADGQLDECELTFKDLRLISASFSRVFAGIYHQRIDYPEGAPRTGGGTGEGTLDGHDRSPGRSNEDKGNVQDRAKGFGPR